jgi:hypothetical protein
MMRRGYLPWSEARVRLRMLQQGYRRTWKGLLYDWWVYG